MRADTKNTRLSTDGTKVSIDGLSDMYKDSIVMNTSCYVPDGTYDIKDAVWVVGRALSAMLHAYGTKGLHEAFLLEMVEVDKRLNALVKEEHNLSLGRIDLYNGRCMVYEGKYAGEHDVESFASLVAQKIVKLSDKKVADSNLRKVNNVVKIMRWRELYMVLSSYNARVRGALWS